MINPNNTAGSDGCAGNDADPVCYPVIFSRKIKSTIWGGYRLYPGYGDCFSDIRPAFSGAGAGRFNDAVDLCPKIGEIWSLCDNHNIVALNGVYKLMTLENILDIMPSAFFGEKYYDYFRKIIHFPLILKIIDANDKLSIQLHPDDYMAQKLENYYCGKTEMWYVLDVREDSEIILGFNRSLDENELRRHIKNNTLESVLNRIKVSKNDAFVINPGTVHAIGSGVLVAEIQQNCDITYRVYDYARVERNGKQRELHIEKAIKCVDYNCINPAGLEKNHGAFFYKDCVTRHINSNKYFDVLIHNVPPGKGFDYSYNLPVFSVFMNTGKDVYITYGDGCCNLFPEYSALLMPAGYKGAYFKAACDDYGIELLQTFTLPDTADKINIINAAFQLNDYKHSV